MTSNVNRFKDENGIEDALMLYTLTKQTICGKIITELDVSQFVLISLQRHIKNYDFTLPFEIFLIGKNGSKTKFWTI